MNGLMHRSNSKSFDHLVGAAEQRERHGEPERLGGPQVNDQLDFRELLDRQVRRPLALQNSAGVDAGRAVSVQTASTDISVAHQAAGRGLMTFAYCINSTMITPRIARTMRPTAYGTV